MRELTMDGKAVGLLASAVAAGVLALTFGMQVTRAPATTVAVAVILFAVPIIMRNPRLLFYGLVIMAFSSVPGFVPTDFGIGGIQFRFYEPLLLLVAGFVATRYRGPDFRVPGASLIGAALIWGVLLGLATSNPDIRVLTDVRPLLTFFLAYYVSAKLVRSGQVGSLMKVVAGVLWVSAGVTVSASILGFGIANMQSEAAGSTDTAARLIGPSTYLAVAVLSGLIALYIGGRVKLRDYWMYWLPALPLVTLTFSRNILIALAASALFALVATISASSAIRAIRVTLSIAVIGFLTYSLTSVLAGISAVDWLRAQFDGYVDRVIGGLGSEAISQDGSARFRLEQENAYIVPEIKESIVLGHGYGYAYKPLNTGRAITEKSEYLRYYAHNFYLWLLVKVGFLGFVAFLLP